MDIIEGGWTGNDEAWPTIEDLFPGTDPMPPCQYVEEAILCKSLKKKKKKMWLTSNQIFSI